MGANGAKQSCVVRENSKIRICSLAKQTAVRGLTGGGRLLMTSFAVLVVPYTGANATKFFSLATKS